LFWWIEILDILPMYMLVHWTLHNLDNHHIALENNFFFGSIL
jgi:hypothetical protein